MNKTSKICPTHCLVYTGDRCRMCDEEKMVQLAKKAALKVNKEFTKPTKRSDSSLKSMSDALKELGEKFKVIESKK